MMPSKEYRVEGLRKRNLRLNMGCTLLAIRELATHDSHLYSPITPQIYTEFILWHIFLSSELYILLYDTLFNQRDLVSNVEEFYLTGPFSLFMRVFLHVNILVAGPPPRLYFLLLEGLNTDIFNTLVLFVYAVFNLKDFNWSRISATCKL